MNAGISGSCSLGMKTEVKVFAVFYSATKRIFLTHRWKSCYVWNTSQWVLFVGLHTSQLYTPPIARCVATCPAIATMISALSSLSIFTLAVRLIFHIVPKKKSGVRPGDQGPHLSTWEIHIQTVTANVSKTNGAPSSWRIRLLLLLSCQKA